MDTQTPSQTPSQTTNPQHLQILPNLIWVICRHQRVMGYTESSQINHLHQRRALPAAANAQERSRKSNTRTNPSWPATSNPFFNSEKYLSQLPTFPSNYHHCSMTTSTKKRARSFDNISSNTNPNTFHSTFPLTKSKKPQIPNCLIYCLTTKNGTLFSHTKLQILALVPKFWNNNPASTQSKVTLWQAWANLTYPHLSTRLQVLEPTPNTTCPNPDISDTR